MVSQYFFATPELKQHSQEKQFRKVYAEHTLKSAIDQIKIHIKKAKNVQLICFATFKAASRKACTGVNPKTGEKIKTSRIVKE